LEALEDASALLDDPSSELERLDDPSSELERLDDPSSELLPSDAVEPPLAPALALLEPYRSEYQPPPLSTKPVPPEMSRLAFGSPHLGQSVSASSFMDCWASHWLPQPRQLYS